MKAVAIILFVIMITGMVSCIPMDVPVSAQVMTPTGKLIVSPTSTSALSVISTATPTVAPIAASPLPTQLTIVSTNNPTQMEQQDEIKSVIQAYFDLRYSLLSISPPADIKQEVFDKLISNGEEAKDFLITEVAKLSVERKWYEVRDLRYAKYDYSLEYQKIEIDDTGQVAEVSVLDRYVIVREWAVASNPESPSSTRGDMIHKIKLHKEDGEWRIVSDIYRDAWWRQFREAGDTIDDVLQEIERTMELIDESSLSEP